MLRSVPTAGVAAAFTLIALMGSAAFGMVPAGSSRPSHVLMATDADGRAIKVTSAVAADGQLGLGVNVAGNLVAVHSDKCLDVTGGTGATRNGTPIQQYDCLGSTQTNQIWSFQNEFDAADGYRYFNIVAAHSGKCLDVTGGIGATGNHVPVQQYDCLGSTQTNQQWRLVVLKIGLQFIARHSGKCLDVYGGTGATGNGVPVQQYDCLGITQTNQLWHRY